MKTRCLIVIAAILLAAAPVRAQSMGFSLLGLDGPRTATGGGGVIDSISAAAAAYSFRKVTSAYAGSAARIRRTIDNLQIDVGFIGSDFDTVTATTHCAATTCYIAKWYDQSGSGRDIAQAGNTSTTQPQLIISCVGGKPCAQYTTTTQSLGSAVPWTPASPVSLNVVTQRSAGTGTCSASTNGGSGNRITDSTPAGYFLFGGGGSISITAGDTSWDAVTGAVNGAASYLAPDGVATNGTVTPSAASAAVTLVGGSSSTCNYSEFLVWEGVALTSIQLAALTTNQRNFWGF